jgi:hypothetical protein
MKRINLRHYIKITFNASVIMDGLFYVTFYVVAVRLTADGWPRMATLTATFAMTAFIHRAADTRGRAHREGIRSNDR